MSNFKKFGKGALIYDNAKIIKPDVIEIDDYAKIDDFTFIYGCIGTNAVVHPGETFGEEAIIGSNSLVLKDIEPWTINVGSPTKVIGKRPKIKFGDI